MKSKKFIMLAMLVMCFLSAMGTALVANHAKDAKVDELVCVDDTMESDSDVPANVVSNVPKNVMFAHASTKPTHAEVKKLTVATVADELSLEDTKVEETSQSAQPLQILSVENTIAARETVIELSDEEFWNLCKIVACEAGDSCREGQICVANVIINRVKDGRFPNSVNGVIFAPGQFTPVSTGWFYNRYVSDFTANNVRAALAGENNSLGALYFSSVASANKGNWASRNLPRLFECGGNVFFAG